VEFTNSQSEASTALPNSCIYGSCGGIDLIVPSVDDRVAVEIMDELHDALFQLVFRADADLAEHGAGGFGEEPLDEIEPIAVFGGEHERKASFRSRRQPSLGLLRDMRGAIVEDDLDRGHRGVGSILCKNRSKPAPDFGRKRQVISAESGT
jgi:hypothetical protein